jgi:HK97 gp10 family phage protein
MAKYSIGRGLDDYIRQLGNLADASDEVVGRAVYEGAKVVADAIKSEIQALPVDDHPPYKSGARIGTVTTKQKQGLAEGFGIAKMKDEGGYKNVKVGFAGYNSEVTEKYPNGQPNPMIARAVNSGTSFRKKNAFVDRAVRRVRQQAEQNMQKTIDEIISKKMK